MYRLPGEQDGGQANGWGHSVSKNTISSYSCGCSQGHRGAKGPDINNSAKRFFLLLLFYQISILALLGIIISN